jgi:hypothetical protein
LKSGLSDYVYSSGTNCSFDKNVSRQIYMDTFCFTKVFCQYQFARLGQELGNYVDNKILGQRTAGVQSR